MKETPEDRAKLALGEIPAHIALPTTEELRESLTRYELADHVAWLRYSEYNGTRPATIHLCDSDAPGAFKVYRDNSRRIRLAEAILREFDRITSGWPIVAPTCPTCGGGPVIKLSSGDCVALNRGSDDDPERDAVEAYIRDLKWSDAATDMEKTLVAGNIRGFYAWLRSRSIAE